MSPKKQANERDDAPRKIPRHWRLLIAWAIALTLAAIILMVFRQPMVSADTGGATGAANSRASPGPEVAGVATCEPGWPALFDSISMEALGQTGSGVREGADSIAPKGCGPSWVWSATMTVGEASDSSTSYLGYSPSLGADGGGLDDTDFSYDGVDYIIESLYYLEHDSGVMQLVFYAAAPLPDELVLQAGHQQFFVSDSLKLGANGDIHAWRLDRPLNWTEGQTVELQIRETGRSQGQLSQCIRRPC